MCDITEQIVKCYDPEFCPGTPEPRKALRARVAELEAERDYFARWVLYHCPHPSDRCLMPECVKARETLTPLEKL